MMSTDTKLNSIQIREKLKKIIESMQEKIKEIVEPTRNPIVKYARDMLDKAYKDFTKDEITKKQFDTISSKYNKIILFRNVISAMQRKAYNDAIKMLSNGIEVEVDLREDITNKILNDLQTNEELFKLNKKQIKEYVTKYL